MSLVRKLYHFRRGGKEVYLPSFVVTLVQTPSLPAIFARFYVPLTFNKLDLRDYLFNVYGVRALRVRSAVHQQPVITDGKGRKTRAPAKKSMTIEMDTPFIWPEAPKDLSPWDKETYDAASEQQEKDGYEASLSPIEKGRKKLPDKERKAIAEQAKDLLSGKEEWKPTWEFLGSQAAPSTIDIQRRNWKPTAADRSNDERFE